MKFEILKERKKKRKVQIYHQKMIQIIWFNEGG